MRIDTNNNAENGAEPGSKTVARLSPARRAVYDAFVAYGPMTDDELVENSGIAKGTSSPRRGELVKLGLIECLGTVETVSGKKVKRWGLVPPERIAEARSIASTKGPRRRPVTSLPLDKRLEIVRQLLDMDDVNDAIREQTHGRAWSRVRGRANDRRGERNREIRENDAKLREAEERGSPLAEYFKLRRILMKSTERVLAVNRLVTEELDRRGHAHGAIPEGAWPDVADLLNDLARTCDETNTHIRAIVGDALGDDVIDGEVIEIGDDLMLPEGDADPDDDANPEGDADAA